MNQLRQLLNTLTLISKIIYRCLPMMNNLFHLMGIGRILPIEIDREPQLRTCWKLFFLELGVRVGDGNLALDGGGLVNW